MTPEKRKTLEGFHALLYRLLKQEVADDKDPCTCDREEFCLYAVLEALVSGTATSRQLEIAAVLVRIEIRRMVEEVQSREVAEVEAKIEAVLATILTLNDPSSDDEEGGGGSIH